MSQADDRRATIKGGAVARITARWCRDPVFQRWIEAHSGRHRRRRDDETPDQAEAMARALILVACGIKSRAELDHDAGAAARFDELVRRPYLEHLAADGQPTERRMDAALAGRMDSWLAGMLPPSSPSRVATRGESAPEPGRAATATTQARHGL